MEGNVSDLTHPSPPISWQILSPAAAGTHSFCWEKDTPPILSRSIIQVHLVWSLMRNHLKHNSEFCTIFLQTLCRLRQVNRRDSKSYQTNLHCTRSPTRFFFFAAEIRIICEAVCRQSKYYLWRQFKWNPHHLNLLCWLEAPALWYANHIKYQRVIACSAAKFHHFSDSFGSLTPLDMFIVSK